MFNVTQFISAYITYRGSSLFLPDIEANKAELTKLVAGKKVLVIGGAGTIGASFIRAILPFRPSQLAFPSANRHTGMPAFRVFIVSLTVDMAGAPLGRAISPKAHCSRRPVQPDRSICSLPIKYSGSFPAAKATSRISRKFVVWFAISR